MRPVATPRAPLAFVLTLALDPYDPGITRHDPTVERRGVTETATAGPAAADHEATGPYRGPSRS